MSTKFGSGWQTLAVKIVILTCLKISFQAYDLMMNSITRSLNMVAILTKKIENNFFVNKTIYLAYTCKKPFSK